MANKRKLYLELYFGRLTPTSEPIETPVAGGSMLIGPFDSFITTYGLNIGLMYKDERYSMDIQDDMIFVNNIYFSDWATYAGKPDFGVHEVPTYSFPEAIKKGFVEEF